MVSSSSITAAGIRSSSSGASRRKRCSGPAICWRASVRASGPTRSAPAAMSRRWPTDSFDDCWPRWPRANVSARRRHVSRCPATSEAPVHRLIVTLVLLASGAGTFLAQELPASAKPDAVRFAVIGDNGTGDRVEYEGARQMVATRVRFPFEMVLMLGDNIYGRQEPRDFMLKFEEPYRPLLEAGVRFYAALGNHDDQANRFYKPFNMGGERYYSYA